VSQDVEADEIGQAECRHLRPADRSSGQCVHFLDAKVHLLHQAHDVQRGERPDAISNEVRRVLCVDHAFAHVEIAEVRDGLHRCWIGVGRRDKFQQPHVARRIEEVRSKPIAAEVVGKTLDDLGHRQAAGVRRNDGAGLADCLNLAQQAALDLQILDDGLDDPVHVGQVVQIVVEVPDRYQPGERRFEERRRLRLHRGFQTGGCNTVARGTISIRGNNIE